MYKQLAALGTQIALPKPVIQEQKPILIIPKPKQKIKQMNKLASEPQIVVKQQKQLLQPINQLQIKSKLQKPTLQKIKIQTPPNEVIPQNSEPQLSYVIIRTVKIKQVVGEVIVNYLNQCGCLKIRNRVLSFVDVRDFFKNICNIEQRQLKCVDTNVVVSKNEIGWKDCVDCEEYMLE